MSSAIIFINKLGVAVAADSAVTIGERKAIFNTAQKIFPIGTKEKAQILGITFNHTNFMSVPIELMFKKYSRFIAEHSFLKNSIEDYMFDFIRFVEEHQSDFAFKDYEWGYLYHLFGKLFDEMFTKIMNKRSVSPDVPKKIFMKTFFDELSNDIKAKIDEHASMNEKKDQVQNMVGQEFIDKNYPKLVEEAFRDRLANFYNEENDLKLIPEKMELDEDDTLLLSYFKTYVYQSMQNHNTYRDYKSSGIYFAGYGEKSLYPSYWGIEAFAFLNGKFVYELDYRRTVRTNDPSFFKTLAQDDTIISVITDVNWSSRYDLLSIVQSTMEKSTITFIENNPGSKEIIEKYQAELNVNLDALNYFKEYSIDRERKFLSSLAVMGVVDMAEYAENLISLQSLKRKYELDAQNNATVGGPTDVAIITKFEGFKWIKSKATNS
jgi:hypothetical protein